MLRHLIVTRVKRVLSLLLIDLQKFINGAYFFFFFFPQMRARDKHRPIRPIDDPLRSSSLSQRKSYREYYELKTKLSHSHVEST